MILFYDSIGEIKGLVHGRIHTDHTDLEQELNGKKLRKLVIEWKAVKSYDEKGNELPLGHPKTYASDFEPDHQQKELIRNLEKNPNEAYNYLVDIQKRILIKK